MSAVTAYLTTELRLKRNLQAISARRTPAASISRISFTSSSGAVISSILPGRVRLAEDSAQENDMAGAAPRAPGRGPHALSDQFLMHAALRTPRSFGPILIAHQQPDAGTEISCAPLPQQTREHGRSLERTASGRTTRGCYGRLPRMAGADRFKKHFKHDDRE